jgi:lysophospholipid acyltransferase (LPLAT)-like uncharacterized protein
MMSDAITRLGVYLIGLYSSLALRLLSATWRMDTEGLGNLDERLATREKVIAVFWHGKYYSLLPLLRNRDACVFTSVSYRGAVIADILRRFGYIGVQLPDHGGDLSLDIMRTTLKEHRAAAIAVDGPLGPYHVVHRGAVQLASELGHSIIPLSIASSRKVVLSERWDNFEMPRMFSRIQLVVGEPIHIPPDLDASALDHWIATVHQVLNNMDQRANALLIDGH